MSETQSLELWGVGDICESLDWTRHRLKLARESEGFPAPGWVVSKRTEIWDASAVRSWYAASGSRESTRAWRRAEAVRMYRAGETVAEICRQLGAKRDTIAQYLRDANERLPRDRD